MPQRRFLIASSLARLIRRDQDMVGRIVEGYFPARPERDHFISIEPGHCFLVLAPTSETAGVEEVSSDTQIYEIRRHRLLRGARRQARSP